MEEIPEYRVKTPLQSAIQILKRHRDIRFADDQEHRPISIILTTLAGHTYQGEPTISGALYGILARMDRFIQFKGGSEWIPNPSDPRENFADKWRDHPERRDAFIQWLRMARSDFESAADLTDIDKLVEALAPKMGRSLVESAAKRTPKGRLTSLLRGTLPNLKLARIMDAPHRQPIRCILLP